MTPAVTRRWRFCAAPFRRRLLADLLDALLLSTLALALWRVGLTSEPFPAGPGDALDRVADAVAECAPLMLPAVVAWVFTALLYGTLTRSLLAGTLGERAMGLRLVGPTGGPAGPTRAALHSAAQLVGGLTLGMGYMWALVDLERRTFAEHITGARLVVGVPEPDASGGR